MQIYVYYARYTKEHTVFYVFCYIAKLPRKILKFLRYTFHNLNLYSLLRDKNCNLMNSFMSMLQT